MTEQPRPDPEPKPAGRQQNWPTQRQLDPQEQMPAADPLEPAP